MEEFWLNLEGCGTVFSWEEKAIGEIAEVIGGGTPKTSTPEFWGEDIPWITPKDLSSFQGRYISRGERSITEAGLQSSSARLLPENTVLLSSRAPIGYLAIAKNPVATNQGFKSLVLKKEYVPEFYYYFLKANVNLLERHASGSTFKEISGSVVKSIKVPVPPVKIQKAIVRILGSLDDKIELNQQMNRTLEATARAIFKSWFVDFDPVRAKIDGRQPEGMDAETAALFPAAFEDSELGMIPKGWKVRKLSDLAQNISESFDFSKVSEIVFVNTGDVLSGRFLHENRVSKDGLPGQAKKSISPNDILISEIRPANKRYALVDFDSSNYVVSTKFMIIRALDDIETKLLYRILTLEETLTEFQMIAESRSGTFPQITFSSIGYFPIILAPKNIQLAFTSVIGSFENQIKTNDSQSRTLATLRDTLLPKLMSGEIRVVEAEKMVEDVA